MKYCKSFFKVLVCAVIVPVLFYCQSPLPPLDTSSDYAEFESVWQWCKALSVYQDSSAFEGRIPSDPFVFSSPQEVMRSILDTLKGWPYTDYDRETSNGASAVLPPSAITAGSIISTTTVSLDSLTPSTALLTIGTFFSDSVYYDFLTCVDAASRFPNIVIDLRANLGGYIEQAVSIIASFVPLGTPFLQVRQRAYDTIAKKYVTLNWSTWATEQEPLPQLATKKLAVLMDGWSASASEITISGLYEGRKALLIGTQSYGKGMGQSVVIRRTRKPLLITSLLFRGVSTRIGFYHRIGIAPDTVPTAIKQQGAILDTVPPVIIQVGPYFDTLQQQPIFYAVKMLDSTATPSSINYPAQHNPAPGSLSKTLPCYYRKIYQDNP